MSKFLDTCVTLDAEELAALLHKSPASVRSDLSRNPLLLPPRLLTGGKKPLWLMSSVLAWLESRLEICAVRHAPESPLTAPPNRKRGRPMKTEQIAKQRASAVIGGAK